MHGDVNFVTHIASFVCLRVSPDNTEMCQQHLHIDNKQTPSSPVAINLPKYLRDIGISENIVSNNWEGAKGGEVLTSHAFILVVLKQCVKFKNTILMEFKRTHNLLSAMNILQITTKNHYVE